jgi:hypothetical protein
MTALSTRTIDRPPVAKPMAAVSRPRSIKPATVSASALALHLDCRRTDTGKFEAEGVFHRAPDGSGFDRDASRVAYLRFLRREKRQSGGELEYIVRGKMIGGFALILARTGPERVA